MSIPEEFEGKDCKEMLFDTSENLRDEIYAEDHFHDFEDYTRAVRTKKYKYVKNYYEDLPNTPSADIIRGRSWQSMKEEKKIGTLTQAQKKCFEIPRATEELFDVVADPYELYNLADDPAHLHGLTEMRGRLDRIRRKSNDITPSERTPDDFFRETGLPTKYRIRPRPSKAKYMEARAKGIILQNPDMK